MRMRVLAAVAVFAGALLAPAGASAATISVTSIPFASTVGLSWDVTAADSETVFRAPAPCTSAPMGGAVPVVTFTGSPPGSPPAETTTTDAPGDGTFCYYVQDDNSLVGYGNTIQALVDTTPPGGTLDPPNAVVRGTILLTATASDNLAGVDKVEFQSSPANANTWTTFDTDNTNNAATYGGTLDTTSLVGGDGLYDLRVKATDLAGNVPASVSIPIVAGVRVDNTPPSGTLTSPGAVVTGTFGLTATASDAGAGVDKVEFQSSPVGANTWTTFDTDNTDNAGTYHGTLNSNTLVGGDGFYDLRVKVTDLVGNQPGFSPTVAGVRVDNTVPSVTMTGPASPSSVHLPATVSANASDSGSGVAQVEFFAHGSASDISLGTDSTGTLGSYSVPWNPNPVNFPDGVYTLWAVATDNVTLTTTSAVVGNVRVDNTLPSGTLTAPVASAKLAGAVNVLSATASDGGSGVLSVKFESSPNGTTWSLIATSGSVSSPYTANWNTGSQNAALLVHAVITDNANNVTTTPAVSVTVDNTKPTTPAAPTGLTSVSASPTISFVAVSDLGSPPSGIGHYDIFRNGGVTPINVTPIPAGGPYTWSDVQGQSTTPASGTNTYAYTVAAVDLAGNVSIQSPPLSIFMDATAQSAPTSVSAPASPTSQRPQVSWGPPSWTTPAFTIHHYKVYRNGSFLSDVVVGTAFTDNQPSLPDNSYSYQVIAASSGDATVGIASAAVTVVYDATAPTAPAGVVASPALDGSIGISWTAASDGSGSGIARYVVRRSLSSVPPVSVSDGDATCQGLATSCTDATTINGKLYSYAVFAVDNAGNISLAGVTPGVTARDQLAPAAPKGLSATPADASVALKWAAAGPDDDVAGYVLVAKQGPQAPANDTDGTRVCAAILATSTNCTATGLTNGATYTFGLFALDEALNRSLPAVVSSVPNGKVSDATAPAAVSKLKAKVSGHTVTLTWKNPADHDFDHVEITAGERKPAALKASKRVYSGKGTKARTALAPGQSRWFVVVAYDIVGNASAPASVHVTIAAPSKFGPAPRAKVHGKVRLSWPLARRARYYNVQVYAGKKRILVSWPAGRALQLPRAKLKRGTTYTWYVWPGLGAKAKAHYGKLIGKNVFTFTG